MLFLLFIAIPAMILLAGIHPLWRLPACPAASWHTPTVFVSAAGVDQAYRIIVALLAMRSTKIIRVNPDRKYGVLSLAFARRSSMLLRQAVAWG